MIPEHLLPNWGRRDSALCESVLREQMDSVYEFFPFFSFKLYNSELSIEGDYCVSNLRIGIKLVYPQDFPFDRAFVTLIFPDGFVFPPSNALVAWEKWGNNSAVIRPIFFSFDAFGVSPKSREMPVKLIEQAIIWIFAFQKLYERSLCHETN